LFRLLAPPRPARSPVRPVAWPLAAPAGDRHAGDHAPASAQNDQRDDIHNRLLYFDELMAGLVPDRGREDCLAAASRYLAVWLSLPS